MAHQSPQTVVKQMCLLESLLAASSVVVGYFSLEFLARIVYSEGLLAEVNRVVSEDILRLWFLSFENLSLGLYLYCYLLIYFKLAHRAIADISDRGTIGIKHR